MDEEQIKQIVRRELTFLLSDRFLIDRLIQILDGRNIQLGRATGTKIGTASDQKLAFFGATPVVRQATIADPSGGLTQDAEARTAINTLIDRLQAFGLIS